MTPAAIAAGPMTLKRKKWTEEEERSLIDKYAEMQSDGTLGRMRTREKKFRPIAAHVNAGHHAVDPVAYPFLWSWKDACTKVQNMRHQYLLVKQKLHSALRPDGDGALDWSDGLSLWPNFLRYKHVFGDAPLRPPDPSPTAEGSACRGFPVAVEDGDLGIGLGFECGGEEIDEEGFDYEDVGSPPPLPLLPSVPPPLLLPAPPPPQKKRKKRPERRAWARLAAELAGLREREARMEEREVDRERKRQERERAEAEVEERERQQARLEAEEVERRRQEEEREWEERMVRRRAEWRDRMEGMLLQHRAEMENMHVQILDHQQTVVDQLLSIVSHLTGHSMSPVPSDANGIGAGMGSQHQPYHDQMMQNLHHMNEMVPGENRVSGDGQEDQFIVDG